MAITVTVPVEAPTNLSASLVEGGSLEASTTYYYVVIAYDQAYYSPGSSTRFCFHSPISEEDSFTTDETNKSALITWDDSAGATRYQILVSKTSGDYTDSGGYGTTSEQVGSITSGATGYTVTALSTENYVIHSCQLVNSFVGDIDQDLGILKVELTGTNDYDLDDIYDAIDNAGFGDYVSWDEATFILKGWIIASGTDAGSLVVTRKTLVFLKGGICNNNPNYEMRFGEWTSDIIGAKYTYGCRLDFLNSRYSIKSNVSGGIKIYGSIVTSCQYRKSDLSENKSIGYYIGASQHYIAGYVDEFRDSIFGMMFRSYSSTMSDIKMGGGNNFGSLPHYRLKIWYYVNMPYTASGRFYECDWQEDTYLKKYTGGGGYYNYNTYFYNNNFLSTNHATNNIPDVRFRTPSVTGETITGSFYFHYEVAIKVIDEQGNAIEGATISLKDKNGNAGNWIEYDTEDFDKNITGNEYTTDRETDANGEIAYYVLSVKKSLDPDYETTSDYTTEVITDAYSPYTLKISKSGFKTYESTFTLAKQFDEIITLSKVKDNNFSKRVNFNTQ